MSEEVRSRPCKYHPDRPATRILAHGAGGVCEDCWALIVIGKDPEKAAAIERAKPGTENTTVSKDENKTQLFCKTPGCNRPLRSDNKTGLCVPCKLKRKPTADERVLGRRGPYARNGKGPIAEAVAQLRQEREDLNLVIAMLEKRL